MRVICMDCSSEVSETQARREITLLARSGKGGTLSGVREPTPTGRWRCDSCQRARDAGATIGQAALL